MDKQTAIQYANAMAFRLRREITGHYGDAFTLTRKLKTKEGGIGFVFASETYPNQFVLRCNPCGQIKLHVYDKDGNVVRKNIRTAQYGADADVNHLFQSLK